MTKAQFFLAVTVLGSSAYAWYTNARMSHMQRDLTALRTQAVEESKKDPDRTRIVLSEKTIERLRAGESVAPNAAASAIENPPGASLAPELDPAELRRRADENAVHLQEAVFAEARDPRWDTQAEAEIRHLDELFPRSSIRATECRRTMCYIDVVHEDVAAFANWSIRASLEPSQAFSSRLSIRFAEPDGKISTKVFLVRRGEELPAID